MAFNLEESMTQLAHSLGGGARISLLYFPLAANGGGWKGPWKLSVHGTAQDDLYGIECEAESPEAAFAWYLKRVEERMSAARERAQKVLDVIPFIGAKPPVDAG